MNYSKDFIRIYCINEHLMRVSVNVIGLVAVCSRQGSKGASLNKHFIGSVFRFPCSP